MHNNEQIAKRIAELEFGVIAYANRILDDAKAKRKSRLTHTLCEWAMADAATLTSLRSTLAK